MSAIFAGNLSGYFTQPATAAPVFLPFPTGVDFINVYNVTNATAAQGVGVSTAIVSSSYYNNPALFPTPTGSYTGIQTAWCSTTQATAAGGYYSLVSAPLAPGQGFFYQNTTISTPSAPVATIAVSGAAVPVVATGTTTGLVAGSIVRIYNQTGALQLDGIDFTVGAVTAATSFTLSYMQQIGATVLPGQYRIIPYSPYYYPARRIITQIVTSVLNPGFTDVTLSVTHNYVVGMRVRFVMPTVNSTKFGMPTLDGMSGTIIASAPGGADGTTSNIITVDIPFASIGGTFAWPLTTDPGFTPPQVIPYGANTPVANAADITNYADARLNTGQTGILLMPTITTNTTGLTSNGPAGFGGQTIYWTAGKSFNT